jgi:pimeloyl-ACP methyl ester carboxylesterase
MKWSMFKVYFLVPLVFLSGTTLVAHARSASPANNTALFTNNDAQCEEPKENFLDIGKIRVRYVEAGTGPVVVMIHGNAGSVDDYDFKSLGQLCGDHRVIAVDRPGHGKSDRPDGTDATLQVQTHLLHETLVQLGVKQPVIVGHSWGGALALAYAVMYPNEVSAIVLLAPAAYSDGRSPKFMRAVIKTPLVGDATLTVGRLLFGKHVLKKELEKAFYPEAVPPDYLRHASSTWLHHKELRAILEDEWSLNKDLEKTSKHYKDIRIPVIIVTGDHDKVVSAKANAYRLKSSVRKSQLIELKDTGHQVPQTHPESIYHAVSLIPKTSAQLQ